MHEDEGVLQISMYLVDMGAGGFNACDAGFSDHGGCHGGGDLRRSEAYATGACCGSVQQQVSIRLVRRNGV